MDCSLRTPSTSILCSVFEDADDNIECFKVDDDTCSTECPVNYGGVSSADGGTCEISECDARVPVDGSCVMSGDSTDQPCYSLAELDRCYSVCPQHTVTSTSIPSVFSCDLVECSLRTPNVEGVCSLSKDDECYTFGEGCYLQCPVLTTAEDSEDKVCGSFLNY